MKKRLPTFVAGMLTAALIGGLGVTALAAAGQMTITVDPINIQVNGTTFQPKDANGADVPVFAYNGTTYAPLRALAEAYGLEVGYDAQTNMATVTGDVAAPSGTTTPAPDTIASATDYSDWTAEEEAAYQEFKGMWEITLVGGGDEMESVSGEVLFGPWERWELASDDMNHNQVRDVLNNARACGFADRLANELRSSDNITHVELCFSAKVGSEWHNADF